MASRIGTGYLPEALAILDDPQDLLHVDLPAAYVVKPTHDRAPSAVVCLLSAALMHDLTDESPAAIQIAVPRRTWRPMIDYPTVDVFTWDAATIDVGLTSVEAAPGESVRIYSPARTVADLMRLRSRMGSSTANIALRRYLSSSDGSPVELLMIAERLDVLGPVRTAVDILKAS